MPKKLIAGLVAKIFKKTMFGLVFSAAEKYQPVLSSKLHLRVRLRVLGSLATDAMPQRLTQPQTLSFCMHTRSRFQQRTVFLTQSGEAKEWLKMIRYDAMIVCIALLLHF